MGWGKKSLAAVGSVTLLGLVSWGLTPSRAQQPKPAASRHEVTVVESFDAKYLGDTPGHVARGRIGNEQRPNVALGDPVYHGERLVGKITGVTWDRSKESLEVEIDPEPFELDERGRPAAPNRIAVG